MTVNKAEVRVGTQRIELVLVAEDEAEALQEDRGDLFFTISVENREPLLYIGHYPGTRTGAPIREARGCPLRAWEREGRVHCLS
jgi:hypothetical protein